MKQYEKISLEIERRIYYLRLWICLLFDRYQAINWKEWLNNPQNFLIDPQPWADADPRTYARVLGTWRFREQVLPSYTLFIIDGCLYLSPLVLYRLGNEQSWFLKQLHPLLESELQQNRNKNKIKLEGWELLTVEALNPNDVDYQVLYIDPDRL